MSVHHRRDNTKKDPGGIGWRSTGIVGCLLLPLTVVVAEDDAYLKRIQSEAFKVDAAGDVLQAEETDTDATNDIGVFENELEEHYRGSYLFYKKLPNRSRREVYLEYQKGASIDDIRKKIMSRYLHKR